MKKELKNPGASVRQRLLNLSRKKREDFNYTLNRYAIERFLFRLGRSPYAEKFILKGATLFLYWQIDAYRQTRDINLLMFGSDDPAKLEEIFKAICRLPVEEDGLLFNEDSVKGEVIRDSQEYGGARIFLAGNCDSAKIRLQFDIGFGDRITPQPVEADMPVLLDHPAPHLKIYPPETFIAEKFEAMVKLGMANSRLKDFFDVWMLSQNFLFQGEIFCRALENTFNRRKTPLPADTPLALTAQFYSDPDKNKQWKSFLGIKKINSPVPKLPDLMAELSAFLLPALAMIRKRNFEKTWNPPNGWK